MGFLGERISVIASLDSRVTINVHIKSNIENKLLLLLFFFVDLNMMYSLLTVLDGAF